MIKTKLHLWGEVFDIEYDDVDDFNTLPRELCTQVYGVCFCDDKLVIGFGGKKKAWGLIGGTIEPGESFEETLKREIIEESNMEVTKWLPLGYQKITDKDGIEKYQLRAACLARPLGDFVEDPAGSIKEIKLINPADYKQYFDWGEIGDRIIERALELKSKL
jgi:8-oxo-dGTP pyrophosphatase MutT (NUDIX family)